MVVVKGGHLDGDEALDVVYDGTAHYLLRAPRVETANVHGSGCTFSAAAAAHLAHGAGVLEALRAAKAYVTKAIRGSARWSLWRHGHGPVDHLGFQDAVCGGGEE